jgi:monoamine oxidase
MNLTRRQAIGTTLAATALPHVAMAAERTSALVIGGGLAGLNAALMLQEAGADVVLLEGSSRIGGRVFTADDVETRPEYGASQIGRGYARTIDLCRRFDLKLVPENRDLLPMSSRIRGQWVRSGDWASSPVNKLVGEERQLQPALLGSQLLAKYNPLKDLDDWLSPEFAALDIPFGELLRRNGHSPEALRLADLSTTGNDLMSASCLSMMQEQTRGRFDRSFGEADDAAAETPADRPYGFRKNERREGELAMISNIEGGTSRLTDAMARRLGDRVRTGKLAVEIDMSGRRAEVRCLDGSRYAADYVVAAVPFTLLRRMIVTPTFTGAQAEAVHMLPYAHTTRAFGVIEAPYWEQDGLEPSFFSDEGVEMFWALERRPDESFQRFMVVLTGGAAGRYDLLPLAEARGAIEASLARLRPAMAGKLRTLGFYSWERNPLVQGCRHMFAPGQVTRLAETMIKPHHRLHLAGEHTRRLEYGMEAALESGERAAIEVMERMA